MARTKDETIRIITNSYLDSIDVSNPPTPAEIQSEILDLLRIEFETENNLRSKGDKWRIMDRLCPAQIADILLRLHPIINVACAGTNADREYDMLAIYQDSGPDKGIYLSSEHIFRRLVQQYCYTIKNNEFQEVLYLLKDNSERKTRCADRDLIAVNNGIFDYQTKQLMDFSPDFVFIAKSKVNYNPQATNVVIHNPDDNTDWNVESWIEELSDDPEIVQTLWEIFGAVIRPNVRWNKAAWFYSNTGNNGKGTICELLRNLTGEGSYASIPLSDFGKDFMLEPLTRATSIIVDENDVGTYIDKAANLKAIITNDVIQMNRKFKQPIAYQFKGFMIQCLNEMPRIKDKSDSFYRRQLFIPFTKCFTGKERKYIKEDYLKRPEVLEYVMYKVLNMNYYTLSEPTAAKMALEEYKEYNDPIRQFLDEILPDTKWDLLPFQYLYDLYKVWFKENAPNGQIQGKNTFINDVKQALNNNTEWIIPNGQVRTGELMNEKESLAYSYGISQWQQFIRADRYRGLVRISTTDTDT